jgi:hypothetical protein
VAHANKYTINVQPVPSKTSAEEVSREMKLRLNAASITLLSNSGESRGHANLDFAGAVDATSELQRSVFLLHLKLATKERLPARSRNAATEPKTSWNLDYDSLPRRLRIFI